jgi:chromosome segregation ATPase
MIQNAPVKLVQQQHQIEQMQSNEEKMLVTLKEKQKKTFEVEFCLRETTRRLQEHEHRVALLEKDLVLTKKEVQRAQDRTESSDAEIQRSKNWIKLQEDMHEEVMSQMNRYQRKVIYLRQELGAFVFAKHLSIHAILPLNDDDDDDGLLSLGMGFVWM